MPQTIVKVKTFMCPTGVGNTDAVCRFHRAWDNLPEDNKCPTCHLELVQAVDDIDRITMTVMGEEDIELEIENPKDFGIDVSTTTKKNAYRAKRRADIANAIIEAKKHEDI